MIDLEKYLYHSERIALLLAIFLMGGVIYGDLSWWWPIVVAIAPLTVFLVVVFGALAWSFWLSKE